MALPGMGAPMAPVPEWPGAVSGKFTDKLHGREHTKRPVPCAASHGPDHGLARRGFEGFYTDTAGLAASEGKRQVQRAEHGEVFAWRPSKRCLSEPGADYGEKREGRRLVELPPARVSAIAERRHIRQVESKEEIHDRPQGKTIVHRPNNLRASDQPAREVDISDEMARKVRADDLATQRNGLGCRVLGDKPYRHPEYDRGFYKTGQLVVGSGFTRGHFKKTEPRNSTTVHFAVDGTRRQLKSYEEKFREQQVAEAQDEVKALTGMWEAATLKDCDEAKFEDLDSDDEAPAAAPS